MNFPRALSHLAWLLFLISPAANAAPHPGPRTIPQCTGVTLSAAYLAQVTPSDGPGFLLTLTNNTDQPIRLAKPFPSSAHWYAQAPGGRWLWRASTGSGGALVNALAEHGPLIAYPAPPANPAGYLVVGAHQHMEVTESMRSSPILRFRPGCQRCKNPEDASFRAVLAYAYLPGTGEQGLLGCGLRSGLIVMPPLK